MGMTFYLDSDELTLILAGFKSVGYLRFDSIVCLLGDGSY